MSKPLLSSRYVTSLLALAAGACVTTARPQTGQIAESRGYTAPCASDSSLQVTNGSGEAIRVIGALNGDPNLARSSVLMSVAPGQKLVVPGRHAEMRRIYAEPVDNPTLPNNSPRQVQHVEFRCIPDSTAIGN